MVILDGSYPLLGKFTLTRVVSLQASYPLSGIVIPDRGYPPLGKLTLGRAVILGAAILYQECLF
jgi:hypothetical protein